MEPRKSLVLLLVSASLLISCAATKASDASYFNPTIYYKPTIRADHLKCPVEDLVEMHSPEDKVLATICKADFARCVMQGSCFVVEKNRTRSFNYYARGEDTIPRFTEIDLQQCPFGYGMRNICLDPYFTVAADLKLYKLGDVIFVPRLVGVVMPDGEIHDGFLVVRDAGGGIQGVNRFDFFTGFYSHLDKENTLAKLGFGDKENSFEFRMASDSEAASTRERRGYPGVKKIVLPPQQHRANDRNGEERTSQAETENAFKKLHQP